MEQLLRGVTLLLILCAGNASAAMYLDPHGQGQVLLYPYYTVNAGQSSLIAVVNTTARGKFARISFHQGVSGEEALDFYVYLAPHDTWTATLFATDVQGLANLLTDDTSCTNPDVHGSTLPKLPDGRTYVPFVPPSITPPGAALLTREGYVDVIEAGELDATSAGLAGERRCDELRAAVNNLHFGTVTPPGGGLYGSLAIVNAAAGTYFATQATAIGGFSNNVLLTNLSIVGTELSRSTVHEAQISFGNRLATATYADSTDAVSALLMSDALWGDFVIEPAAGASTEWVLTQPTMHYYVEIFPFETSIDPPYAAATHPTSSSTCLPYSVEVFDREQHVISSSMGSPALCTPTNVLRFGSSAGTSVLGSRLTSFVGDFPPVATSGSMRLKFAASAQSGLPAVTGPKLAGLPVMGFQLINYVNANVVPGVLANYAATEPLRPTVACADATGAAVACP